MKAIFHRFVVIATMLTLTAAARAVAPLEAVVRDANERYRAVAGSNYTWPSAIGKTPLPAGTVPEGFDYYGSGDYAGVASAVQSALSAVTNHYTTLDSLEGTSGTVPLLSQKYHQLPEGTAWQVVLSYWMGAMCEMTTVWFKDEKIGWVEIHGRAYDETQDTGECPEDLYDRVSVGWNVSQWGYPITWHTPPKWEYYVGIPHPGESLVGGIDARSSILQCDTRNTVDGSVVAYVKSEPFAGGTFNDFIPSDYAYHAIFAAEGMGLWRSPCIAHFDSAPASGPPCDSRRFVSYGWSMPESAHQMLFFCSFTNESSGLPGGCGSGSGPEGCGGCSGSGCQSARAGGVNFQMNVGSADFGKGNSSLSLRLPRAFEGALSSASLELRPSTGTEVLRDPDHHTIRQLLTGRFLADVTYPDYAASIRIRLFPYSQRGSKTDGFYSPTGSPVKTVTIENPAEGQQRNYNRVVITTEEGTATYLTEHVYNPDTGVWTLYDGWDGAKYLRTETVTEAFDETNLLRTQTHMVMNTDATKASHVVSKYQRFGWGEELVEQRVLTGASSAERVSTWEYYTDPVSTGTYGRLKLHVDASGRWEKYDYDSLGRVTKRVEPFKNSKPTDADALCRVFETSYSWSDEVLTETHIEKLLGVEVSRSTTQSGFGWTRQTRVTSPNDLVSQTGYITTSSQFLGRTSYVHRPDGTVQLYEYALVDGDLVTTMSEGEPDTAKTAVVDGTRMVTRTNAAGIDVCRKIYDFHTGANPVEFMTENMSVTSLDSYGEPLGFAYLDGTTEQETHICCGGAETKTDRMGITTVYGRDALKRVTTETRQAITTRYTLDAKGRTLKTERIGTDGSVIVQEVAGYNWAGDLLWKKDAMGRQTSYENTVLADYGGVVERETRPDGSFVEKAYYVDGSMKSISGSAVHPEGYDYGVANSQRVTKHVRGSSEPTCSSCEYTSSTTDGAGRTVQIDYADGAQATSHYNALGQLWKSVDPDGS